MRSVVFTSTARRELIDAWEWYEHEQSGLGDQFLEKVEALLIRIQSSPLQFPLIHRSARRALLERFPYTLVFTIEPQSAITIIACWHGSRNPELWRRRVM